jgi:hypothetical protein
MVAVEIPHVMTYLETFQQGAKGINQARKGKEYSREVAESAQRFPSGRPIQRVVGILRGSGYEDDVSVALGVHCVRGPIGVD